MPDVSEVELAKTLYENFVLFTSPMLKLDWEDTPPHIRAAWLDVVSTTKKHFTKQKTLKTSSAVKRTSKDANLDRHSS